MNASGTSSDLRIAVLGGGISGLSTAFRLEREAERRGLALTIDLYEAQGHLGGSIQTRHQHNCVLEQGPDCFITTKPHALELSRELGIASRLIGTRPECRRSFIVQHGRLLPLPEGFFLLAPTSLAALARTPLLSVPAKLRCALELFVPRRRGEDDESLADFVRRRFGEETLEAIAQPMVAGIYSADPERLSLAATFPQFIEMEQRFGSVIRGLSRNARARTTTPAHAQVRGSEGAQQASGPRYGLFASFDQGMGVLIDALKKSLRYTTIRRSSVRAIARDAGDWQVRSETGNVAYAAVCCALPMPQASRVLAEVDIRLANELGAIRTADSITINLGFQRKALGRGIDGMGFVVPARERMAILACSFSHNKFAGRAPQELALLRVFMGGATRPEAMQQSDAALVATAQRELGVLLGIKGEPEFSMVSRHRGAMPQYDVGHLRRVASIRQREAALTGFALAGNGLDGVGVPDCIRNAERAAKKVLQELLREQSQAGLARSASC